VVAVKVAASTVCYHQPSHALQMSAYTWHCCLNLVLMLLAALGVALDKTMSHSSAHSAMGPINATVNIPGGP